MWCAHQLTSTSHLPSFFPSLSLLSLLSPHPVDFAVGAPYEEDGDSTGVVYVYYGNSDLTLFSSQTPVRVGGCMLREKVEMKIKGMESMPEYICRCLHKPQLTV